MSARVCRGQPVDYEIVRIFAGGGSELRSEWGRRERGWTNRTQQEAAIIVEHVENVSAFVVVVLWQAAAKQKNNKTTINCRS